MKSHFMIMIACVLVVTGVCWSAHSQEDADNAPLSEAEAQATMRREDLDSRRAQHQQMRLAPEARETARALRREEMREVEQAVEVRNPIPLPVEIRNAGALIAPGTPVGGTCPADKSCNLARTLNPREVLVVTAAWGATKMQCDDVTAATPPGGVAIAPWWRCQHRFAVEGVGAGYTGFLVLVQ